jgi:membrane carboxypeptidase/penicillin-binding protein
MRRRNQVFLTALLGLPLLLLVYETFAVFRARAETHTVLQKVAQREVPIGGVPQRRVRMLLAVEDPSFFRHRGVDFSTAGQGMTTMTQSLAKFLYFDRFTPGFAKLELMLIARFALEPSTSKREQLEIFFNHARFGRFKGRQVKGFAAAARSFYGKPLEQLSDREYLSLVAMLVAPNRLDPVRHPRANEERTRRIIALLRGLCRPEGLRDVYYEGCAPVVS